MVSVDYVRRDFKIVILTRQVLLLVLLLDVKRRFSFPYMYLKDIDGKLKLQFTYVDVKGFDGHKVC